MSGWSMSNKKIHTAIFQDSNTPFRETMFTIVARSRRVKRGEVGSGDRQCCRSAGLHALFRLISSTSWVWFRNGILSTKSRNSAQSGLCTPHLKSDERAVKTKLMKHGRTFS